ncbi:hypothetical protein HPB52_012952 [Rhipicephalus sanguineus]|uniref:Fe2OG dioxygenase domain-containing protein n=1 Tax=Rhipicephalus sanguineus TaxID=34632 RepID=A0A9D4PKS2_RHISA|nr:hypothetical protein HPB52_012952 [Rhipicephalus sanguineus]
MPKEKKHPSQVSWLKDSQHKLLESVSRRIEVSTGLSLESAEAYQVSNYGLGGHYTPHLDAFEFDKVASRIDLANGNRLATVLMYLSNVAAGGATAFVDLGTAVKPRVGDALFWYDVEPYTEASSPRKCLSGIRKGTRTRSRRMLAVPCCGAPNGSSPSGFASGATSS